MPELPAICVCHGHLLRRDEDAVMSEPSYKTTQSVGVQALAFSDCVVLVPLIRRFRSSPRLALGAAGRDGTLLVGQQICPLCVVFDECYRKTCGSQRRERHPCPAGQDEQPNSVVARDGADGGDQARWVPARVGVMLVLCLSTPLPTRSATSAPVTRLRCYVKGISPATHADRENDAERMACRPPFSAVTSSGKGLG